MKNLLTKPIDPLGLSVGAHDDARDSDESSPLTVTELSNHIKSVVDQSFKSVVVVGEISNLSRPSSGHAYFSLKDEMAQIDAVMWRSSALRLGFELANGMEIVCYGDVEVYAPHGRYKLIARRIDLVGSGRLEMEFRRLEERYRCEGLFEPARKKKLPSIIRRIGAVTSPTSAAIHDFLRTLAGRSKRIDVVVAPAKVQGDDASKEIAAALKLLNARNAELKLDAIALIRGGGSMEDLWAFNEEPAVRAVAESQIPIVTGIGHEIDTSLCDLAADVHALTPTSAAVQISNDDSAFRDRLDDWSVRCFSYVDRRIKNNRTLLESYSNRRIFLSPGETFAERRMEQLEDLSKRLVRSVEQTLERKESAFKESIGKLDALSPLAVLKRGYSLTKKARTGEVLTDSSNVAIGDTIETTLANGVVRSVVVE